MSTKVVIIAVVVALIVGVAAGRYSKDDKVVETTKTVTQDTKQDTKITDTEVKKNKVVTITVKPDGTKTTVITDRSTTDTTIHDKSTDVSKTDHETFKEVLNNTNRLNVSLLAGHSFSSSTDMTYGISLTRALIGPVTITVEGIGSSSDKTLLFGLGVNL